MSGCDRTDIEAMKEDRRQKAAAKRAAAGPEDETAPAAAEPAQVFDAPVMAGAPRRHGTLAPTPTLTLTTHLSPSPSP